MSRTRPATTANPLLGRLRRHTIVFGVIIAVLVGGFGTWGATAPIASAAVAGGQLLPAGLRMTVQHLEGGLVREILVKEGDEVEAGQPLIVFDGTRAESNLEYDQTQMMRVEAMKARLEGHETGAPGLVFPPELIAAGEDDPEFAAFLDAQRNLYIGEAQNLATQMAIFDAQIGQLEADAAGRREEIAAADEQLVSIADELERKTSLLSDSLIQRSEIVQLQRLQSEYRSRKALAETLMTQVEQRLAQVNASRSGAPEEFQRVVAEQLSTVNLQLAQLRERVRAGQDILDRTTVRAPVAGTVLGMRVNTPNAVLNPGQPVLDIVPKDEELVVFARLSPIDIDTVHVGLQVEVHVLSFVARNTLPINGTVTRVSADAFTENSTGQTYYTVEIALDESTIRARDREVLISGMPVEVYIFTGSRTFLEYLTSPIMTSFRRSFRDT